VAIASLALALSDASRGTLLPAAQSAPTPSVRAQAGHGKKVVFLHVQTSGGTSFTSWICRLHASCARGIGVDGLKDDDNYFGYNIDLNPKDQAAKDKMKPDATAAEAGGAANLTACGVAQKVCHFGFKEQWTTKAKCTDQVQQYVDAGCTFVELHHYDISVTEAFRSHGYEVMTFLREPVARATSEMNKYLHAKGDEERAYGELLTPDNGMRLFTACDTSWFGRSHSEDPEKKEAHDVRTSCAVEFRDHTHKDPEREKIGQAIFDKLNISVGDDGEPLRDAYGNCDSKNATNSNYKHLFNIATSYVDAMDFVGVIERAPLMLKAFAKHFGVTAPLPTMLHDSPTMCPSADSCMSTKNITVNDMDMERTLLYDQWLWCSMSESLTTMATKLGVEADSDHLALKKIGMRCEASRHPGARRHPNVTGDVAAGLSNHTATSGGTSFTPGSDGVGLCIGGRMTCAAQEDDA